MRSRSRALELLDPVGIPPVIAEEALSRKGRINVRSAALILTALASIAGFNVSFAGTLRVITAADTNDPLGAASGSSLGPAFNENNTRVHKYLDSLHETLQMTADPNPMDISGDAYSCDAIMSAVRNLHADPDDVVIFYHSGHGESPEGTASANPNSLFPSLLCSSAPDAQLPNLEEISNILRQSGARLVIVVADSCNELTERPPTRRRFLLRYNPASIVRTMFLNFKGYILMSSSIKGEASFYPIDGPGFFTSQLLDALQMPVGGPPEGLWNAALEKAKTPILLPRHDPPEQPLQHPQSVQELTYMPSVAAAR